MSSASEAHASEFDPKAKIDLQRLVDKVKHDEVNDEKRRSE